MIKNHYTSKIVGFNDLESLTTYGFRGEALHAIRESSFELEILSKSSDSPLGSLLTFDSQGNVIKSLKRAVNSTGTSVSAKQLFHRTPVRRERYKRSPALKKSELKDIETLILGFSLVYPAKRFILLADKSVIFQRPACKTFRDAVIGTLGKSIADKWNQISLRDDSGISVDLWLSQTPQDLCRSSNDRSFIFVNGRPIELPKLLKLIKKHLGGEPVKKRSKSYPICLVRISVPLKDLDANVEPSKKSVFFKHEDSLLQMIDNKLAEVISNEPVENSVIDDCVKGLSNGSDIKASYEPMELLNHPNEPATRENTSSYPSHAPFEDFKRMNNKESPCVYGMDSSSNSINTQGKEISNEALGSMDNYPREPYHYQNRPEPNTSPSQSASHQTSMEAFIFNTPVKAAASQQRTLDKSPRTPKKDSTTSFKTPRKTPQKDSPSAQVIDHPIMCREPGVPFQNNSFISSTLLQSDSSQGDAPRSESSFVNSSKEDSINTKMSSLHDWATGKFRKDSSPVGLHLPKAESRIQRIAHHSEQPPTKKKRSLNDTNSLIQLMKPQGFNNERIRVKRREIEIVFDFKKLRGRFKKKKETPPSDDELSIIGKLEGSEIWTGVLREDGGIYVLQPSRFREVNTYNRLLRGQSLSPVPLPYPLKIPPQYPCELLISLIQDERILKNGFMLSPDGKCLTHACTDLFPSLGLPEFIELLDVIGSRPEASLDEVRPPCVQEFFGKECLKLCTNSAPGVTQTEMLQLIALATKHSKRSVSQETCFHRKKLMLKLMVEYE